MTKPSPVDTIKNLCLSDILSITSYRVVRGSITENTYYTAAEGDAWVVWDKPGRVNVSVVALYLKAVKRLADQHNPACDSDIEIHIEGSTIKVDSVALNGTSYDIDLMPTEPQKAAAEPTDDTKAETPPMHYSEAVRRLERGGLVTMVGVIGKRPHTILFRDFVGTQYECWNEWCMIENGEYIGRTAQNEVEELYPDYPFTFTQGEVVGCQGLAYTVASSEMRFRNNSWQEYVRVRLGRDSAYGRGTWVPATDLVKTAAK